MSRYYAEARDGSRAMFDSRATTAAGLARAALKALGVNVPAAAYYLGGAAVDEIARREGLEVWRPSRRGMCWLKPTVPLTLEYDTRSFY